MGNRCADHVTPLNPQKLALTSPTGGGRSVGIVRSRTKATEFSLSLIGYGPSFMRFLDHTQRRTTVGMTSLDGWSARRRDLYLRTHNTYNRQTCMPPVGFEPTISAGERIEYIFRDRNWRYWIRLLKLQVHETYIRMWTQSKIIRAEISCLLLAYRNFSISDTIDVRRAVMLKANTALDETVWLT